MLMHSKRMLCNKWLRAKVINPETHCLAYRWKKTKHVCIGSRNGRSPSFDSRSMQAITTNRSEGMRSIQLFRERRISFEYIAVHKIWCGSHRSLHAKTFAWVGLRSNVLFTAIEAYVRYRLVVVVKRMALLVNLLERKNHTDHFLLPISYSWNSKWRTKKGMDDIAYAVFKQVYNWQ